MAILYHQLMIMYILIALGYLLRKIKFFTEKEVMALSSYAINIAMTASILSGMNIYYSADKVKLVVFIMAFQIAAEVAIYLVMNSTYGRYRRRQAGHKKIYMFALLYCNAAMVGYPIVTAMFGEMASFIASLHIIAMNISMFSVGMALIKSNDAKREKIDIRKIFTPTSVITFAGLILFFCRVTYPSVIGDTIKTLSNTCMPVAMIVTGAMLAEYQLKKVFLDIRAYVISIVRLLIIPLLVFFVFKYILHVQDDVIIYTEVIIFACPSPSGLGPFVKLYGGDYELAVHIVSLSAILSSVTMPLLMTLIQL